MKRLICLLLAALLVMTMFVSCFGPKDDPGKDDPGKDDDGEDEDPPVVVEKEWYEDVKFTDKTISLYLSNNADKELAPGCRKYMQGPESSLDPDAPDATGFEKVQNEVLKRNDEAKATLGLNVSYEYSVADWGSAIGDIREKEASAKNPDMYCNMMYDMGGLTTQNVFSNILKYTQEDDGIDGWAEGAGYLNIKRTKGYNIDLMKDMALTEDKQFLIASDYFLDVLRAMIVMPFNMDMYTNYANPTDANCEELYAMVENGEWTWDKLINFRNVYTDSANATLESNRALMALSVGGLSAIGLIYSTAFTNYTVQEGTTVSYKLNEKCDELTRIFAKAADIVNTKGVVCGPTTRGDDTGVLACKKMFTDGHALFAGPNMLGVIEETEFGNMTQLSILPVPKVGPRDEHNTAINSRARVGALSYKSANKAETTAWIQFCTEKSAIVREEYFDKAMNNKYLAGSGAAEMLTFIYEHIGDNKSMILDNMIMASDWTIGHTNAWSQLIKADDFKGHANDIDTQYRSSVEAKQTVLNGIVTSWYNQDTQ